MSALRRIVSQNMVHMKNVTKGGMRTPVVRNMSTLLEGREKTDEARYIRSAEQARAEEIRKNLERIMALEDSHQEKAQLVELLEPKAEKKGFIEKWGLNDWKIATPVGILTVLPLIENNLLLVDADMLITGCFFLVCGTMYNQFGHVIHKSIQDDIDAEYKALRAVDNAMYDQIKAGIDTNTEALSAKEELTALFQIQHDLKVAEAEVMTNIEAHKYREAVVAKLDALQALEEAAVREIRAKMISKVNADVLDTFKNDKKAKENALNQAINVLAGGASAKMGKDVVGEAYAQSLASFRENYAKQPEGSDPVLKKLAAELAVVGQAPTIEAKGGNVYTLQAAAAAKHH